MIYANGPRRSLRRLAASGALALCSAAISVAANATSVIVNGKPLDNATLTALQRAYPVPIAPGRYWYDAVSGAYGVEGGPIAGQMLAGLRLGGALRADASRGTSGVFINGRQLQASEKAYIEWACQTPVIPARYWVNAQGVGGYAGAPPSFNLALCRPPGGQRASGGSSTRTFCDADGSCRSSGILGSILTVPR